MDPSQVRVPPMKDLTVDNITENTILMNSQNPDARLKFVLERLVSHLHDFARETRLSNEEWMAGLQFLTETGQKCTDVRQEFILLSDTLGLSCLVDAINHPKPLGATEASVLGPFHTHDAEHLSHGESISSDKNGDPCLCVMSVKDLHGNPIPDVKVDIWETDSSGHYDTQYDDRIQPDGRCVLKSDENGNFWFKAIRPVSYPIPHDGPVGRFLLKVHRHPYRPAHMHFMFEKQGWDHLITALYIKGDSYETSDAVFGVKDSLVVDFERADAETAKQYSVIEGSLVLKHNFVLASDKESSELREEKSREALERLGHKVQFMGGLPVPDVD